MCCNNYRFACGLQLDLPALLPLHVTSAGVSTLSEHAYKRWCVSDWQAPGYDDDAD
jgi:hypothetical protein